MPARRKPIAELKANGTVTKNPGAYADRAANEVVIEGSLSKKPPVYFTNKQKQIWYDVLSKETVKLYGDGDEYGLEMLTLLIDEMRSKLDKFTKHDKLLKYLDRFGMTPYGRSYLRKPPESSKPKPKTGFAALRAGDRGAA